ncbi:hypothetical protein H0H87_011206 [Tephrocybe sp. NHM501043]|nr:hypothetical protein H0H87_011206 [Tephrocybe sp. NHM501043]
MPLIGYATTLAKFVWAGSPEALTSAHVVLVEWFSKRRVFDVATLSKIKCPVSIIRFEEDIAYQLHDSEEFVALLRDANVKVDFHQVSGPHFGHVTHSDLSVHLSVSQTIDSSSIRRVNPILCEHVLSVAAPNAPLPMAELNGQRKERLDSPFKKDLMKFGFRADELDTDSSADA